MNKKKVNFTLLDYQKRVLDDLNNKDLKIISFLAGTGAGKTYLLPLLLLYYIYNINKEAIIIVSSPTIAMTKRTVLRYITTAFDNWEIDYTLNKVDMIIKLNKATVYFISATEPDKMQGIHANLIIGDEAGLFSKKWLDTAIQRTTFKKGKIILTTTPYSANHWLKYEVYDKWQKGDKSIDVISVPSYKNPFYPKEEIEKAKLKLPLNLFQMLYLAQFPEVDANSLFSPDVFMNIPKSLEVSGTFVLTVDVARHGEDRTVIGYWIFDDEQKIAKLIKYEELRIKDTQKLAKYIESKEPEMVIIDTTGLGWGVYDRLIEDDINALAVEFSAKSREEKYLNKRAEIYFKLAEFLKQGKIIIPVDDDKLLKELKATKYEIKRGKLGIVDKDKIKEELGYSPDIADSIALISEVFENSDIPFLL